MDKNDTTWIRIVYDPVDEELNENPQLRDLVIESEEIAALCEMVNGITAPLPGSYTASY